MAAVINLLLDVVGALLPEQKGKIFEIKKNTQKYRLGDHFKTKYGGRYEIYNCRNVRGGSSYSLHAEGRAVDIYLTGSMGRAVRIFRQRKFVRKIQKNNF